MNVIREITLGQLSIIISISKKHQKVNWKSTGFRLPTWIYSILVGTDIGTEIASTIQTLYQYLRYPGVRDLNKLYGLDFVPGKTKSFSKKAGYIFIGVDVILSALSNFTNNNLSTEQQWISFGVDTAYTVISFGVGVGVSKLVSLIPYVGVYIAPFASIGATMFVDWLVEKEGWLDELKQWIYEQ